MMTKQISQQGKKNTSYSKKKERERVKVKISYLTKIYINIIFKYIKSECDTVKFM